MLAIKVLELELRKLPIRRRSTATIFGDSVVALNIKDYVCYGSCSPPAGPAFTRNQRGHFLRVERQGDTVCPIARVKRRCRTAS